MSRAAKLINRDGTPREKQKPRNPRGVVPPNLIPHLFKKGDNTIQRKKRVLISTEVRNELQRVEDKVTKGTEIARGLVQRAMKDSTELRLVMEITEPEVLQKSGPGGGFFAAMKGQQVSMVMGKLFSED